jgi:WD40 repeat protein
MAVAHGDYAVLASDGSLVASRNGHPLEIRTEVRGEGELALSSRGVIAIADYAGSKTWFVRPGGTTLEPGPVHASQPFSLATDDNLAAWGYTDGTVIALDTMAGTVWKLKGHAGSVLSIAIDSHNARVTTATSREVRVWDIKPPASSFVATMPCAIFSVRPSPDGAKVALDCGDGSVWVWSRDTAAITHIHDHAGPSYGVEWVRGMVCSGGWADGRVLCSNPDGTQTQTSESGTARITWVTATSDHQSLLFTSGDGKIWQLDTKLHELYTYNGVAHRMAVSGNNHLLASCAHDGSVEVYDLTSHRLVAHKMAHAGGAASVSWVDDELWTGGNDGALKRWVLRDGDLVLRHSVQVPSPLRLLKVVRGGWAANVGEGVLMISVDGVSIAVRLDIGKSIEAIDVSPDLRYVAVGVSGEIVVVDLQRNAIATLTVGSPIIQQVSFLDATSLAFSEPAALKTLRVDHLDYVTFQSTPEALDNATF